MNEKEKKMVAISAEEMAENPLWLLSGVVESVIWDNFGEPLSWSTGDVELLEEKSLEHPNEEEEEGGKFTADGIPKWKTLPVLFEGKYYSLNEYYNHHPQLLNENRVPLCPLLSHKLVISRGIGKIFLKRKTTGDSILCYDEKIVKKPAVTIEEGEEMIKKDGMADVGHKSRYPENTEKEEVDGHRKVKKVKKFTRAKKLPGYGLNPKLPLVLKNGICKMEGLDSSLVLVIEKGLYKTDVSSQQGRFSIPQPQIRNEFLTKEEREYLHEPKQKGEEAKKLAVKLVDPATLNVFCGLNLTKWDMHRDCGSKSWAYNLVSKWNWVCSSYGLKQGMVVQLWAFRVHSELHLALVKVESTEAHQE